MNRCQRWYRLRCNLRRRNVSDAPPPRGYRSRAAGVDARQSGDASRGGFPRWGNQLFALESVAMRIIEIRPLDVAELGDHADRVLRHLVDEHLRGTASRSLLV